MKNNQKGIYLITQGQNPGTIFKNQGKKDLVYSWLREGGIGGFVGDYAFYYYWDKGQRFTAAGAGQQSVFGVTVTNGTVSQVKPTELGAKYIPSLKKGHRIGRRGLRSWKLTVLNMKVTPMMEQMPIQLLIEPRT